MNAPISHGPQDVAPNVVTLASTFPLPGLGFLPINAFLLEGAEPVLIDTGVPALAEQTIAALTERVDPASVKWIWLTHTDADHTGALQRILDLAPRARIVTNYLGMGKLSLHMAVPPDRFYLINPGQTLEAGGRTLQAVRVPSYDAPETMGVFDTGARILFSSDCFGALLPDEGAGAIEDASSVEKTKLEQGQTTWATIDAPWLARADGAAFGQSLAEIQRLEPALVLSSHLPPARGMLPHLLSTLDSARGADLFVGPDQAALEAMLGAAA